MNPYFFAEPKAPFTRAILAEAGRHAARETPRESCGLVRAGHYVPCANVAPEPERAFEIAGDVMAEAWQAGDLEGVIHSHPGGPWYPTRADCEGQLRSGVPWAILVPGQEGAELACHWGAGRPPVFDQAGRHVPRVFKHYVSDCYSLMQDYFREIRGHALPEIPRGWEWWKRGETLYLDHLQASGFEVISTDPQEYAALARPHDAFLMAIRAPTPNHAGVYLGAGRFLDHLPNRLSRISSIGRFLPHITHWLRQA